MADAAKQGEKDEVLSRIDRLRELVEQDAPQMLLEAAHEGVGRSLGLVDLQEGAQGDGKVSPDDTETLSSR